MNYIAIDTSGKNLTVIVSYNGKVETYFDPDCGVKHSVDLMPKIEELIEKVGFDGKKADFLSAVVGAGSFTGIRIGVSTIKAMCFAFNVKCLPITSFDQIAYNKDSGKYLAIIDALHGSYYVCGYENKKVVYPPEFIDKEKLLLLLKEYSPLSATKIDGIETETVSIVEGLKSAVQEKSELATFNLEDLVPLYIRKSQAEEGR